MILPRKEKKEIIDGLVPLLIEVKELKVRMRKVMGKMLLDEGVMFDVKGKPIFAGIEYVISDECYIPVNHRRRINEIIDRSKNMQDLQEDLARYLVKFGKSKEAITDSIPPSLRPESN
jgi:hypothetical protein